MWYWLDSVGVMAWPLALCSVLIGALLVERLQLFSQLGVVKPNELEASISDCQGCCKLGKCRKTKRGWRQALAVLQQHRFLQTSERESVLGEWLAQERGRLFKYLRLIQWLGVSALLLGIVGSVLSLPSMLATVLTQPNVQAEFIQAHVWQVLYSTVWGLVAATVALVMTQALRLWAEHYLQSVQLLLKRCHLAVDGLLLDLIDDEYKLELTA